MKFISSSIVIFCISFNSQAVEYSYQIKENDQLGVILLSLGHRKLWPEDGAINRFKKNLNLKKPNEIWEGSSLLIPSDVIYFKKNILINKNEITFRKKIKTKAEYELLLKEEESTPPEQPFQKRSMAPAIKIKTLDKITIIPIPNKQSHEFNLYPGVGFFTASNYEDDRGVKTSTFSGVQPMIQFKGIYSSDLFGSVSVDLMTKKIINSQFSFPINLDYRMQFVPKWNFTDTFRFALSLSTLKHSYVGKSSTVEVPYELTSHFIGLGVVVPHDHFWYELYVEKAFSGEAKSSELTQKTTNGIRIDTEVVYPIYKEWRILPGINYYYVKNSSTNYAFSVLESRLVFAREFEF